MSEKQKLYLLTDYYPYGQAEPFVGGEVAQMSRFFHVTVVPRYVSGETVRALPQGVELLAVSRSHNPLVYLWAALGFFVSRRGREEIRAVLAAGEKIGKRLMKSLSTWVSAELVWKALKQGGAVNETEGVVYYSFWYTASALALSFHRAELPGAKVLVRTNGYDLYNERAAGGRQPFKPAADAGLDMIVSSCQYGMEYYKNAFGETKGVVHMYSPLGSEDPGGTAVSGNGTLHLVSCSNTVPVKRIRRIIDGLAALENVPVCWTHLGGGVELEALKVYADSRLKGNPGIRWCFAGSLSHEEVLAFYAKEPVDCFITTSASEGGCPVSIQEALAFGVPIIGTAVGGITEMLRGSENILLSADTTVEETAAAIRRMYELSEEEKNTLRRDNRKLWQERYCAEANGRKLAEVIDTI